MDESYRKNPADLAYWWNRPLTYSAHARERCFERGIRPPRYVPQDAAIADVDLDACGQRRVVTFRIERQTVAAGCAPLRYFLVVGDDAVVRTVYRNEQGAYARSQERKRHRRARERAGVLEAAGLLRPEGGSAAAEALAR